MTDNSGFIVTNEPKYIEVSNESKVFEASWENRIPLMLKGPTGSGKTRFIEHMSWKLKKPLITVSCHEDMTASDLVGRFLLEGTETVWKDGPLTRAVRYGGICYLDEIVEARQDTTVVIHSLTDDRRILPIEKTGEIIKAHKDFFLVISYNPGYQSVLKDLKESTKQRFASINFGYPTKDIEKEIINICEELSGLTAYHLSCKNGHLSTTKYLVQIVKVNMKIKDKKHKNGLDYAKEGNHKEIVQFLKHQKPFNPNKKLRNSFSSKQRKSFPPKPQNQIYQQMHLNRYTNL